MNNVKKIKARQVWKWIIIFAVSSTWIEGFANFVSFLVNLTHSLTALLLPYMLLSHLVIIILAWITIEGVIDAYQKKKKKKKKAKRIRRAL